MKIDIEDGNARRSRITQVLGRDRRVVQKTVAPVQVARRVMPRRPAYSAKAWRVRPPLTSEAPVSATSAAARAASQVRSWTGSRVSLRHGVVNPVVARDAGGERALDHAPRGPAIGDGFAAVAGGHPFAPRRAKEFDIFFVVDAQNRPHAERRRSDHLSQPPALHAFEHDLCTLRALMRAHEFPAV